MSTARILVVDDDRLLRQMVRDLLEAANFAVAEAVDGADGLAQAAAFHPDLILLDLMMPDLDGYAVCRSLQADPATRAIPVIFLTISADPSLNRHAYAAGAVACLTKPFRREGLLAVVNTTLQGAAPQAAHRRLSGSRDAHDRRRETPMSQPIICRYCQLPQPVSTEPSDPPGEVYCPNCGGPLPRAPQTTARPTTILWIDDDRLLLGACAPVLERNGYRVLIATDGAEGIATANQERPEVILLDVMMPTMTGFEVCQQLRADPNLKATPIILLTALEDMGVCTMGQKAGATTTLRKPFGPEYIAEFLDKVLGRLSGPPRLEA